MSTRLQVILDDAELETYRQAADRDGVNLSAWVRRALRDAAVQVSAKSPEERIAAIRAAAAYRAPAPPIEQMLAEIERGYLGG
jgi:hypothetical protein